jgi:hypothetical protein
MKYGLISEKGKVLLTFDDPIALMFYDTCVSYGSRQKKKALLLSSIGWNIYLKDGNDTPLGKLADFLAVGVKNIKRFKELSRYDQLEKFYNWVERGVVYHG